MRRGGKAIGTSISREDPWQKWRRSVSPSFASCVNVNRRGGKRVLAKATTLFLPLNSFVRPRENIDKQPPLSSLDAGEAHGRRRRDLCSVYLFYYSRLRWSEKPDRNRTIPIESVNEAKAEQNDAQEPSGSPKLSSSKELSLL
ncbi:hypothetical protein YC2023_099453 [Brassica napus]